ncbi:MAG: PepSY domain-containing protein [Xanthomonadales bacterium]|nr:PepSY domain-containing protein [Xanthomonadales bacterium]
MKSLTLTSAVLASLIFSSAAMAADDCTDPVTDWQPRETLRQQIEQHGWEVQRIKVDDGCYEVRGIDKIGNEFKAKYAPASLHIRKLEITFVRDGDAADYLDRNPDQKTDEPSVVKKPSGE